MERVIRVNRVSSGGQYPAQKPADQVVVKSEQSGMMGNMQHQMEEELERRRKDWEKEVEVMQQDFFQVKLPKDNKINANKTIEVQAPPGGFSATSKAASRGMDILEIGKAKAIYTEAKDGGQIVKFNFDVRGFNPSAITVRAEGSKLTVSAQHEEENFPGSKNTRQHNRQVDIPRGVDPDYFVSRLSADGILTVEAPVDDVEDDEEEFEPAEIHMVDNHGYSHGGGHQLHPRGMEFNEYGRLPASSLSFSTSTPNRTERIITSSGTSSNSGGRKKRQSPTIVRESRTVTPGGITIYRSTPDEISSSAVEHVSPLMTTKQFDYSDPNIVSTEEGHRLKITVTLGTAYKPEEITVELLHRKIIVKAVHEEIIGGRSSKSEFSREFDIPGPVEARSFKAVLSGDGRLSIGGSLKENKDHDAVMGLVFCDMPLRGRAVKTILH